MNMFMVVIRVNVRIVQFVGGNCKSAKIKENRIQLRRYTIKEGQIYFFGKLGTPNLINNSVAFSGKPMGSEELLN